MERIRCTIGRVGPTSLNKRMFSHRDFHDDVKWLSCALEISIRRAKGLVEKMSRQGNCSTQKIEVVLSHRQFARYSALRHTQNLFKYWQYSKVMEYDCPEQVEPCETEAPVELRPGYRTKGDC